VLISIDQHAPVESAANQVAALLIECEPVTISASAC
jgi:hypothetical protein